MADFFPLNWSPACRNRMLAIESLVFTCMWTRNMLICFAVRTLSIVVKVVGLSSAA